MPKRGRKKATGRFDTRQELIARVCHYYNCGGMSDAQIGKSVKVSATTVASIVNTSYVTWSKENVRKIT